MTENHIDILADALDALTRHLERENGILADHDARALEPLAAEKDRLTDEYVAAMQAVRENPELVSAAPEEVKTRLRAAGEAFQVVMQEHSRRVRSLKAVSEGVVKAICDQVEARNRPSNSYGANAAATSGTAVPTSIALDQRI